MTLPLITQLDDGCITAGDDCSVCAILNNIRDISKGKVGPRNHEDVKDWVRDVRKVAGRPAGGLLMRGHVLKVYQSKWLADKFRKAGLKPIRAEYRYNVSWATLGKRVLKEWTHLAVDYGVLRRGDAPIGSHSFSGGHSLNFPPGTGIGSKIRVDDGDSLFDGRTRWVHGRKVTYPKGYQRAWLDDFKAGAGAWGSRPGGLGKATAIFIREG